MNTKGKECEIPKSTNFVGGICRDSNLGLGRAIFIDEMITRTNSSIRTLYLRTSPGRGSFILPRLEPSISNVEKLTEDLTPTSKKRPPKYKGIYVGTRNPEEIYRINGQEVTKEEWLDYRWRLEEERRREEQKKEGNMNNEENREH